MSKIRSTAIQKKRIKVFHRNINLTNEKQKLSDFYKILSKIFFLKYNFNVLKVTAILQNDR